MLYMILKIGNLLVIAIPVFLLASPTSKDLMEISIGNYEGRTLPKDLMIMFSNATGDPDDLQDCMMDFSKCIAVRVKMPSFCGKTVDGRRKNFTSICHLVYENCKIGSSLWQGTDDNKRFCEYFKTKKKK